MTDNGLDRDKENGLHKPETHDNETLELSDSSESFGAQEESSIDETKEFSLSAETDETVESSEPYVESRKERRLKKQKQKKRAVWILVGVLATLVGVIAFLIFYGMFNDSSDQNAISLIPEVEEIERISVPSAAGSITAEHDEDTICERYASIGLECSVEFEVNDEIPRGNIISQDPEAGEFTEAESTVSLVYSRGPSESEFPAINNESLEYVENALWTIGVEISDTEEVSDSGIAQGRVVEASVEEGETVSNGDSVVIYLSDGTIEIPDWTGESRETVESEASELGIDITISTEESEQAEGTVLSQDQSGLVDSSDIIEITVAIPFESVELEIPDVLNLSPEDAQYDLAEAGFRNITSISVESNDVDSPTVTQVVPGVGSTGLSGERVVIVVSEPASGE